MKEEIKIIPGINWALRVRNRFIDTTTGRGLYEGIEICNAKHIYMDWVDRPLVWLYLEQSNFILPGGQCDAIAGELKRTRQGVRWWYVVVDAVEFLKSETVFRTIQGCNSNFGGVDTWYEDKGVYAQHLAEEEAKRQKLWESLA